MAANFAGTFREPVGLAPPGYLLGLGHTSEETDG